MNYFIEISLVIAFLYGIIPSIIKYILRDINIVTLLLCEAIGVFTFTGMLSFYHIENISKDLNNIRFESIYSIILLSFILFIANGLLYTVLYKHESYLVNAVISCSPIFALFVSWFIIKESVSWIHVIGILFIVAGVWLIII